MKDEKKAKGRSSTIRYERMTIKQNEEDKCRDSGNGKEVKCTDKRCKQKNAADGSETKTKRAEGKE